MTLEGPRSFPGRDHLYDLMIVGAGISGSEAAVTCARKGGDVLLITTSLDTVYNLLGDGVRLEPPPNTLMAELHAEHADEKGFVGNWQMHRAAKYALEHSPGIHLLQSSVSALSVEDGRVTGVTTWEGVARHAKKTALCVGSFLRARLSTGELTEQAGRLSEMAYDDLFLDLQARGFAFRSLTLEAPADVGSLAYQVDCKVFAPDEWQTDTFRLSRYQGLYAAGLCAAGFLKYEEAARAGRDLGRALL